MTQLNTLLELRSRIKNKKPEFIRQDNPKRPKLSYKWRKPKGIHSKIRHHFKGRRKMPSPGYKSPTEVKGLHATGLKMVRVFSAEALNTIKKGEGIIISKNVGAKKRLEILRKAKEMNISVLNLNVEETIKKIEDFMGSKKKKEAKGVREETKETKKEEQKKVESPKKDFKAQSEKQEAKLTNEEKKDAEKKEKDKILTKRT